MEHFAKIEYGVVTNVVVVSNEHENNGQEFLNSIGLEGTWVQTSYNGSFRKLFASIGDTYEQKTDSFIPMQPFLSWKFNRTKWIWEAPIPFPEDGSGYLWNEETGSWINQELAIEEEPNA